MASATSRAEYSLRAFVAVVCRSEKLTIYYTIGYNAQCIGMAHVIH